MLHLPTQLTLNHLLQNDRKLIILSQHSHIKEKSVENSKPLKQILEYPIDPDQQNEIAQMLKMIVPEEGEFYNESFVRIFSLIKINSIVSQHCVINQEFIDAFLQLYNRKRTLNIRECKNQEQFFAQIILYGDLYKYLKISSVQNILAGQCLLATTLALMITNTQNFIQKAQITFALSFLALSGRPQAFIGKVHQEKNHKGQICFAKTISQYINIDEPKNHLKIDVESRRVQDPYSMRCAPQVYGVVYDCLEHLQNHFKTIVNKFHFKNIFFEGEIFPNIELFADSDVLKGDFLICSLNEIGSMSFLRSERILNIYLGKNEVHKDSPKEVFELKILLQKTIHCVTENKLIAIPSGIDTMNLDNYEKDIYFNSSKLFEKCNKMFANLYKIMLLEVGSAILGLNNVYHIDKGVIFQNQTIRKQYFKLEKNISMRNKKMSQQFLDKRWIILHDQSKF